MHATFRWYEDPSLADALASRADEIKAVLTQVPGLRSYSIVRTDQGTVTTTVCDDEMGTAESTRVAREWMLANLPDLAVTPPNVSAGDVVLAF